MEKETVLNYKLLINEEECPLGQTIKNPNGVSVEMSGDACSL